MWRRRKQTQTGPLKDVEATPIPLVQGPLQAYRGDYLGYTVKETSKTTPATITIYDNATTAAGPILEEITLQPNESTSDNYPRPGRIFKAGMFAQVTGSVEGSVFS